MNVLVEAETELEGTFSVKTGLVLRAKVRS